MGGLYLGENLMENYEYKEVQNQPPNTYHIWAHLITWSKNQFTLFIHVVKEAWQLGRQTVGSVSWFVKQTLAVTSAMESKYRW